MKIFTRFSRTVLIVFLSLTVTAPFALAQVVDIPDANLRTRLEIFLNKAPGDAITKADMQTLTLFSAVNADIRDLTGLEHATNLLWLELDANAISDITPLTRLPQLALLYLENNPLSAESVDKHIPVLLARGVDVSYTLPSDVNNDGMVNIQDLVSVTQHFGTAGDLTADVNGDGVVSIADFTQVAGDMGGTTVSEETTNTMDTADATDAVGTADTPPGQKPLRTEAFILRKFIDQLISDTKAAYPNLDDADFQPPGKGFYDPYRPGDLFLRRPNHHVLGIFIPDPITAASVQQINNFSLEYKLRLEEFADLLQNIRAAKIWVVAVAYREVEMPDENLREVVITKINELGVSMTGTPKRPIHPIYAGEMLFIKSLTAEDADIEDLTGLEYAKDLERLHLGNYYREVSKPATPNRISDLTPLKDLTNLTHLDLRWNAVENLVPLRDLRNLTWLILERNVVENLDPLRDLRNLTYLNLQENKIIDISPLANLTSMKTLRLDNDYYGFGTGDNKISDLNPLRNLRNLEGLRVSLNPVGSSIGVVRNFPKLKLLEIGCCGISNLRPLVECPGLRAEGSWVHLVYSPLTEEDFPDLAALRARGVDVEDGLLWRLNNKGQKIEFLGNQVEKCSESFRGTFRAAPALQAQLRTEPDVLSSLWHDLSQVPEETALLPNYPNPFNPETWIPYQLALPTEVTVAIHAADGRLVRTLALGYQAAGVYKSKGRAAYWDGRNAQGEPVASGVYFYTLMTGDYTATRKLLIRK